jgi:hypothetical protein
MTLCFRPVCSPKTTSSKFFSPFFSFTPVLHLLHSLAKYNGLRSNITTQSFVLSQSFIALLIMAPLFAKAIRSLLLLFLVRPLALKRDNLEIANGLF